MDRPYDVSQAGLLIVRPLVDAGDRRFLHGEVAAEVTPRGLGSATERGEGGKGSGESAVIWGEILYLLLPLHHVSRPPIIRTGTTSPGRVSPRSGGGHQRG